MGQSILSVDSQLYSLMVRVRRLFPIFKAFRIFKSEGFSGVVQRLDMRLRGFSPWWENRVWVKKFTPTAERLLEMQAESQAFSYRPLISVIVPIYNPEREFLIEAIESVREQVYDNWELCLADDASTRSFVRDVLVDYAEKDPRIKFVIRDKNGHISEASNSALELSSGEFVALLDHDDRLAPHALYCVVRELNKDDSIDVLYSNEDKIDLKGYRTEPAFKSTWSPENFLSFMYVGHLGVYRSSLVESVGEFRKGFEGSQDYDLALRIFERTNRVTHIPEILYHWRKHPESVAVNIMAKPYAFTAGKKALAESMKRRGLSNVEVNDTEAPGIYKVTASKSEAELQMVYWGAMKPEWASSTSAISWDDFLRMSTDQLEGRVLFVNSAIEKPSEESLAALETMLLMSEVGLAAAKVVDSKGKVVHAGYTLQEGRLSSNFYNYQERHPGYGARLFSSHNLSVVGLYCALCDTAALKESSFWDIKDSVKGINRDVALCLSLIEAGKRIVWTPHGRVVYSGPTVRQAVELDQPLEEHQLLNQKFSIDTFHDPFYPRGLDTRKLDFTIAP